MKRSLLRQLTDEAYGIKREPVKEQTDEEKLREQYINSDHPNTMENSTATFLYIVVMIGGSIFNDRWLIYIAATVIYLSFILRKEIRARKWDREHKKPDQNELNNKNNGGNK